MRPFKDYVLWFHNKTAARQTCQAAVSSFLLTLHSEIEPLMIDRTEMKLRREGDIALLQRIKPNVLFPYRVLRSCAVPYSRSYTPFIGRAVVANPKHGVTTMSAINIC